MRHFVLAVTLLLFSVAIHAQSQHWDLYINKTKKLFASVDSIQEFRLSKGEKGIMQCKFPDRSKEFKRTIIIMNEQRNELLETDLKASCKTASFHLDELLSKTGGNPFVIYVRDIPADPQKAMLVRMAPVAVCNVRWKE